MGYSHSSIYWKQEFGHGKFNTLYISPQVNYFTQNAYAGALFSLSINFYDMHRRIHFSSINRTAQNNHTSFDCLSQVQGGGRMRLKKSSFYLQGDAQFSSLVIVTPGYKETGATSLDLWILRKTIVYLDPLVRAKFGRETIWKSLCFAPFVYVGWAGYIPVTNPLSKAKLRTRKTNADHFQIIGYKNMTNQLNLGFEFNVKRCDQFRMSVACYRRCDM